MKNKIKNGIFKKTDWGEGMETNYIVTVHADLKLMRND